MSFSENTSDSDWKDAKVKVDRPKSIKNNNKNKPKYSQRFCEKWLSAFEPWLQRSTDDPDKPFCKACLCRLDSNRCHLVRHERTTKHKRNLEVYINKGEVCLRKQLGKTVRQEKSKYYQQRKRSLPDLRKKQSPPAENKAVEEKEQFQTPEEHYDILVSEANQQLEDVPPEIVPETVSSDLQSIATVQNDTNSPAFHISTAKSTQDGIKLLKQINQDKNELMESFRELMGSHSTYNPPTTVKEKNHVDLFFESVSSSVQALSPKLIAEAKMRVSQLICELELRCLTENNSTNGDAIEVSIFKPGVTIAKQPNYGDPS